MENQQLTTNGQPAKSAAPIVQLHSLDEVIKFSEFLAKSSLVPKNYIGKPADIAVCLLHGHEVGLPCMASLQSIAVINGNPGMYGDAPLALVRNSGLLEYIKEEWDEATKTATCRIKRLHDPTVYENTFSMKDAERIGLASRETYQKYGKRMCQFRARSYPLRDGFGDVLKGMRQAEEFEEFIETTAEHVASEPVKMPSRASKKAEEVKPDATDQRTAESEKLEEVSQEAPLNPEEPGQDLNTLKVSIEQWIDTAPEEEILKEGFRDHLFKRMEPIPERDKERAVLANRYLKRKQQLWKSRRDAGQA